MVILTAAPQKITNNTMDYFELYYLYLKWCEKDNWANMRDPNHDYMEWNHTLPQCIFGDLPFGQWLTVEQHAIASALQTLAFGKNCMFGLHKRYLPDLLISLSWGYYLDMAKGNGKHWGTANTGRVWTEEMRRNLSLSMLGKRTAWNKNKRLTKDHREKMSLNKLIRWRCLETGFVSSSTGLTKYQTRRNIDINLREKVQ